ncbi:unnamed protein product [Prorocentrum cordatum]|uniref:Subtilisin n=1 Tax=Prorocentrum cordatum TaxID=2364126 RepID=A0ABN9USB0_9DINO|nr:unnamed protein product [Polarella glacialis]
MLAGPVQQFNAHPEAVRKVGGAQVPHDALVPAAHHHHLPDRQATSLAWHVFDGGCGRLARGHTTAGMTATGCAALTAGALLSMTSRKASRSASSGVGTLFPAARARAREAKASRRQRARRQ